MRRDERRIVTDIRNAADKLLGAKGDFAEEYFARTLFIKALGQLDEWAAAAATAESNAKAPE